MKGDQHSAYGDIYTAVCVLCDRLREMQPYDMVVTLHADSETGRTAFCIQAKAHDICQRSLWNWQPFRNQSIGESQAKETILSMFEYAGSIQNQTVKLLYLLHGLSK